MSAAHRLHGAATADFGLRNVLLERFGASLSDDEVALLGTLDGVSSLPEAVCAVLRSIDDDEMMAAGIAERVAELSARKTRLGERAQSKRAAILAAMETAGRQKVELPDATVSIRRNPPSLMIVDEAHIPEDYFIPQPAKLDRNAVKAALADGPVPGACLSNGSASLTIRRG